MRPARRHRQLRWQPWLPSAEGRATRMRLIRHLHATRRPCLLEVGLELRRPVPPQVCRAAPQKAAARLPQKARRPWSARRARRRSLTGRALEGEGLALRLIRHLHTYRRQGLISLARRLW